MKRLFIVLFCLLSAATVQAQTIQLGIKGGANYSNLTGEIPNLKDYDRSRLLGFNAGVFAHVAATKQLAIQPELYYSTKGYKINDSRTSNNTTTDTEITHKINYLDLPVLVQLSSGGVYFEAGPQVSFLLDQKYTSFQKTTEAGILGSNAVETRDKNTSTSGYKPADFGYAVGIGFRAPESPLSLNFRYSAGLASYHEDSKIDNKHSVFQVSLSSWFSAGK